MHSMSMPICVGKVLGGMPRKVLGLLRAIAAVMTVHTGNRLQKVAAYLRSFIMVAVSGGGTCASKAVCQSDDV
jgi:hypothetical protein